MALLIGDCDKEYQKDSKLKRDDVKSLQVWLETQPHLPKMSEMQIILFLHSNMYSNEAAKRCIDIFYTVRTHCPEFFAKRNPADLNLDVILYTKLPMSTPEGYSVLYATLIDPNPDKYHFAAQIKAFDMATMFMLNSDGTSPGQVIVQNLKGVTFMHLTKLNPLALKKFFFYLQDCMPVRIKGLHMVNGGSLLEKLMAIIKPFMKKELMDVLHLHADFKSLFEYVPQACFPKEIGGTAPSIEEMHCEYKKNIIANTPYYLEEEKQVAVESQRPGKPKDLGEVFGVEGTFKKLDID